VNPRRVLTASFVGLVGFSLFFLIRPLLDPGSAYRPRPPGTTQAYGYLVVAAFVPYAAAVWAARRGVRLRWALGGTVLLHLLVLPAALSQSQDLYAYLFYGKMWAVHGANPYLDLPLRFASDPWFPWVRWPDQPSVYGPLWTILTAGPAWVGRASLPVAFALTKVVTAALGAATVTGLVRAARGRGMDPAFALLLVAWNPLVIVSLPLGGHADVALAAAWLWALVADRRGRPLLAALLLTAAALVKAYAGVVLLVYVVALARRSLPVAGRAVATAALLVVSAWAPFWSGPETLSGLARIGSQVSSSLGGTVQLALAGPLSDTAAAWIVRVAGLAVIVAVVARVAGRDVFPADPWPGAAAAFAAYIAVTPWFLPWHLAGLLALTAVAASPPLRAASYAFSGTASLTASFGGTWWGRSLQATIRYGVPAVAWVRAGAPPATARPPARSLRPPRS
jgi:glycosyl transferase family 87